MTATLLWIFGGLLIAGIAVVAVQWWREEVYEADSFGSPHGSVLDALREQAEVETTALMERFDKYFGVVSEGLEPPTFGL